MSETESEGMGEVDSNKEQKDKLTGYQDGVMLGVVIGVVGVAGIYFAVTVIRELAGFVYENELIQGAFIGAAIIGVVLFVVTTGVSIYVKQKIDL